jgi:membrane-bound lytic murein transglycosylase MltF
VCLLVFAAAAACGRPSPNPAASDSAAPTPTPPGPAAAPSPAAAEDDLPVVAHPHDALPAVSQGLLHQRFTGDLDEMVKRRLIRAGVAVNRTHYFIDRGVQRGIAYDALMLFEEELNTSLKTGPLKVHVAFMPIPRDQLFQALNDGRVDVLAAQLTVTPEREALAAFSRPTRANVTEVVVSGPGVASFAGPEDLSGQTVFVRKSSSYYASLVALNARLTAGKKAPVTIKEAPESLEDDDLLEMVNAGLAPMTVVDDYLAEFWLKVFPRLTIQRNAALRTGASIAVAFRKDNPRLREAADRWIAKYGPDSAFGRNMDRRYLQSTKYALEAGGAAERKRFETLVELFKKYSSQYDMDFLLMAAQGFQESRLDQEARSHVGAIGVMQIMPATGKELGVGDITSMEPNIHGGVKYMRQLIDREFKNEPMDPVNKGLMAFAAYNAGPGRVRQLRKLTRERGLDPNVWFGNVEQIASERIGRETVQYVSNIFKYYVAYRLVLEQTEARKKAGG